MLAIEGGTPVRQERLPYGRQSLTDEDIQAVVDVLHGDWLTTGPHVEAFEAAIAEAAGTPHAVVVSSGTAALHAAMSAIGIGVGDEVIVTPLTFAASANAVLYQGGTPVFADIDPTTLLIDPQQVEAKITSKTKAVVAVDYAGQPADYDALRDIAAAHNLVLVDDACHAIGGRYKERPVGSLADVNTFSFHPVKHITTGEGGAITTNQGKWADHMRHFRNHGITTDHHQREQSGSWFYQMQMLGYNYRITDFQCALGQQQIKRLPESVAKRQKLASQYNTVFANMPEVEVPAVQPDVEHAYHLYPILLEVDALRVGRREVFEALRAEGIGVNVHYIPVYWHPHYQQLGYKRGICPQAEYAYERLLTLPMFPEMTHDDFEDVIDAIHKVVTAYRR